MPINLPFPSVIPASTVSVTDSVGLFNSTNVEGSLAELGGTTAALSTTTAPSPTNNTLILGGGVAFVSGLAMTVSAAQYRIQGTIYNSPMADLTGSAADPSNPRIDVVAVDTGNRALLIPGTAAATPVYPDIDPATQLALTFYLVGAGATGIPISNTDIYHENTEWTTSRGGTTFTLNSTNNPYRGTTCIEGTNATTNNYFQFQAPGNINLQDNDSLVFYVRSKATWPSTRQFAITVRTSSKALGSTVTFKDGSFGFVSNNTTSYQQIVIPLSLFGANGLNVDRLRFTVLGSGATIGMYFDDFSLQGGLAPVVDSTRMKWRGTYVSTNTYNVNDVVLSSGIQYVCIQAGSNKTPASNTDYWQASSTTSNNIGAQTIWVPAAAMAPTVTAGCDYISYVTSGIGKSDIAYIAFDPSINWHAQFGIAMPKSWNNGTVTLQFYWSHPSTTTNFTVVWGAQAVAIGDGDLFNANFGTPQTVTDTGGTTDTLYISSVTSDLTINGTPTTGDAVIFDIYRDATNVNDTLAVNARLMGVKIIYTTNASNDN